MPRKVVKKSEVAPLDDTSIQKQETLKPKRSRKATKVEAAEESVETTADTASDDEPLATPKKLSAKNKVAKAKLGEEPESRGESKKKAPIKRKAKTETEDAENIKAPKKRKTKEEKEAEDMPLAARTAVAGLKKAMHIGAHVSGAGGVQNSISNALHIGGNSFALFLKSQRKWVSPPLSEEARDQFKKFCEEHQYDAAKHVLPHGSYLVNLAQPDAEKAEQAYTCFLDDLHRCEALGIKLYNFHPGSKGTAPRPEAIARIASQLNRSHKATKSVITVLENMAGSGNVIGATWEDIRDIIALIDDKSRVGVCIDTCHTFAAGYDLRSAEAFGKTMEGFKSIVGLQYLKALHLNDSKAPFASNRDLHANIGTGFLGLRAFHNIVNYEPFQNLPMVLETPIDKKGEDGKTIEDKSIWATEIKLLESLIGADPESEHFKVEEQRLHDSGAEERQKFQGQADKKQQKTLDSMFKKTTPKKKRGKKGVKDEEEASDDEGCSH